MVYKIERCAQDAVRELVGRRVPARGGAARAGRAGAARRGHRRGLGRAAPPGAPPARGAPGPHAPDALLFLESNATYDDDDDSPTERDQPTNQMILWSTSLCANTGAILRWDGYATRPRRDRTQSRRFYVISGVQKLRLQLPNYEPFLDIV